MAMIVSRFESDFENCPTAEIVRDPARDCIHRRDLADKGGKGDAETRSRGDAEGHPVRSATHRLRDPASTLPSVEAFRPPAGGPPDSSCFCPPIS